MSDKKLFKRLKKANWATIIALLGVILLFTGVNFQSISSYISSQLFPKADFVVESWTTPSILPNDFRQSLSVSPEYFFVTSVNLKSAEPYLGEPMRFSVSFENKGKKSIEQPRIVIYFVDTVYRVWNLWNKSATNDVLAKGCSIEYHFPPLDEKVVGTWGIFALVYDDSEGVLVSYELKLFGVKDGAPTPSWQVALTLAVIVLVGFTANTLHERFWKRRKKAKSTTKSKKKDT